MSEFAEYVKECFAGLAEQTAGEIHYRRMFGGHGIYLEGLMFALIADEQLYLKGDEQNRDAFIELGLPPFIYTRGDKVISLSYYQAPDAVFEDSEQARQWGQSSYAAALRGQSRKPSARKKTKKATKQKAASAKRTKTRPLSQS